MADIKDLRRKGMDLKPTIQVGKSGLTEGILNEIDSQLEKTELVKIKFPKSAGPTSYWKNDVEALIKRIKATLVEIKGGTVLDNEHFSLTVDDASVARAEDALHGAAPQKDPHLGAPAVEGDGESTDQNVLGLQKRGNDILMLFAVGYTLFDLVLAFLLAHPGLSGSFFLRFGIAVFGIPVAMIIIATRIH